MEYYFKRDVWEELLDWKNRPRYSLEVRGARQVGKTFILKKFCEENFKQFFYISMAEDTGKDFLKSIEIWHEKFFGQHDNVNDMLELMKTYKSEFEDSIDTVILIDEIQESSRVYNLIRPITRNLKAKLIVTGSYLGKVLDREFFLPAGDLLPLTIYPLSFPEFLDIFGEKKLQEECYRNLEANNKLAAYFALYKQIGGYPRVIIEYLESNDVIGCGNSLQWIMDNFIAESRRYFTAVEDYSVFKDVLVSIAALTMEEKQGGYLIEGLHKIMNKLENRPSKHIILETVSWLKECGIIGYASKLIDAEEEIPNARFYFHDIGMANFFANMISAAEGAIEGFLNKNYVYTVIRNKFYSGRKSMFFLRCQAPAFSVYTKIGGELDFILCGKKRGKRVGIEVIAGKGSINTGKRMLEDGLLDELYVLKGRANCGIVGNIVTMPIYLADQIDFKFKSPFADLPDLRELIKMSTFKMSD